MGNLDIGNIASLGALGMELEMRNDPVKYIKRIMKRNLIELNRELNPGRKDLAEKIVLEETVNFLNNFRISPEKYRNAMVLDKNKHALRCMGDELSDELDMTISLTGIWFCYDAMNYIMRENQGKIKELDSYLSDLAKKI